MFSGAAALNNPERAALIASVWMAALAGKLTIPACGGAAGSGLRTLQPEGLLQGKRKGQEQREIWKLGLPEPLTASQRCDVTSRVTACIVTL